MSGLMGMGVVGWAVSVAAGVVIGGVLFMSIKAQVDYVVRGKGPTWLVPVALYARMAFVAAVLVMLVLWVPREKLAGALLGGVVGVVVARVLISRMVKGAADDEEDADAR